MFLEAINCRTRERFSVLLSFSLCRTPMRCISYARSTWLTFYEREAPNLRQQSKKLKPTSLLETRVRHIPLIRSSCYYTITFTNLLTIPLPDPDDLSEVHDLEMVKQLTIENLPDVEKWGEEHLAKIISTFKEMYGEDLMTAMPEDRIKPAMQGVSILFQFSKVEAFSKIL